MKKLVSLFVFLLSVPAVSQGVNVEKFNEYFDKIHKSNKAHFAVAISENGKMVYQNQVGFISEAKEKRINAETIFRIGSITKTFTAVIVFQLIEEGKLSLETKLSQFYPDVVNADQITVAHLLNHRSGIHNFTDDPGFVNYMTQHKSKDELLKIMQQQVSDFEPGTRTSYSNSGYILLGLIIEKVTGETYKANLTSRIIEKLGLKHTGYGDKIENDKNEAVSMVYQFGTWARYPMEWDMSVPYAAGAVASTASDVNQFIYSLFNGKLVSDASLNTMKSLRDGMGHGIFSIPFGESVGFGHNGRIDNFDTGAYYFKQGNMTISLMSSGTNLAFNDILVAMLSIYYNIPFTIPDFNSKPITIDSSTMAGYTGNFSSDNLPLKIEISVKDGTLMAQATGQGAFPLTPYSNREFRFDSAGITILFGKMDDGVDFSTFILKQGGQQYLYKKE